MYSLAPILDLDQYVTTRNAWHTLAEHVLSRARWNASGRIGLRSVDRGVATPTFGPGEVIRLDASGLHRHDESQRTSTHCAITTLRAAAAFVDTEAGSAPGVFTPTTPCRLDDTLTVHPDAAHHLEQWFAFGAEALTALREQHATDAPTELQLWPEHFDLATDFGDEQCGQRANFGASPGDATIPTPYLYVGPWQLTGLEHDPFWNQPWGAALHYEALVAAPDPLRAAAAFFGHGIMRLRDR